MKNLIFLLLITTSLLSCKNGHNHVEEKIIKIDEQIASLKTTEEKKYFLNELYLSSQGKVEEIDSLEKNFFKNHTNVYKLRHELDSLRSYNAYKAEKYLELYAYPSDTITYTNNQYYALYFAFYHSGKVDALLKGLTYIQKEYDKGNLSSWHFLRYLTIIYYMDKTKFYQMDKMHNRDQLIQDILPEIEEIKRSRNL